jgi:Na+/proline symporter
MGLYSWSWLFLLGYVSVMVGFGLLGKRRVSGADDFATARGGYGPFLLALAFASTQQAALHFWACPD